MMSVTCRDKLLKIRGESRTSAAHGAWRGISEIESSNRGGGHQWRVTAYLVSKFMRCVATTDGKNAGIAIGKTAAVAGVAHVKREGAAARRRRRKHNA
jgi:hypothetical protein